MTASNRLPACGDARRALLILAWRGDPLPDGLRLVATPWSGGWREIDHGEVRWDTALFTTFPAEALDMIVARYRAGDAEA